MALFEAVDCFEAGLDPLVGVEIIVRPCCRCLPVGCTTKTIRSRPRRLRRLFIAASAENSSALFAAFCDTAKLSFAPAKRSSRADARGRRNKRRSNFISRLISKRD